MIENAALGELPFKSQQNEYENNDELIDILLDSFEYRNQPDFDQNAWYIQKNPRTNNLVNYRSFN